MKKLPAGRSLNAPTRRLRVTTAALLALLLSTSMTTTPASAAAADNLDPTFGSGGRVLTDFGGVESGSAVAVQPDGKLVVAGVAGGGGGPSIFGDICVVRYRPDGTLDPTFGAGGKVLTDFGGTADGASDVRVQSDGKIVVVGSAYFPGPSRSDFALARYNADGTPDASFGTNGKVTTQFPSGRSSGASSFAVQPDGRLVVAGIVSTGTPAGDNPTDFASARYNADGTPDATFGAGGFVTLDFGLSDGAAGVALQADGRVVLAGSAARIGGNVLISSSFALARLKADGSPDPTFDGDGQTTFAFLDYDNSCTGVALQPDGRIVFAGTSSNSRTRTGSDFTLGRLHADGSLDQTFGTAGRVFADFDSGTDSPFGLAVLPGGKLVTGGYVSSNGFSGPPQFGAARFNADGSPDNTFGVGGRAAARFDDQTYALARGMGAQPDGKVIVVGDVNGDANPGGADLGVVRFDAGSGVEPSSFASLSATVYGAPEGCAAALVTVAREGDLSAPAAVEYRTLEDTASQGSDYTQTTGTLLFAAGESSKTFAVPVNDDAFVEGAETVRVELASASANVNFRAPASATLTIADDDTAGGGANPLDNSQSFVCQHYHDFLSRQPDAEGLQFWTQGIESCGADAGCREVKRVDVSTAFFLSIEFQQTGYFVIRAHKAAFGDNRQTPRYQDFLRDTQRVAQGIVVGQADADARLEANKQAFALALVARPEFVAAHGAQNPDTYIESLFNNAGIDGTPAERAAAHAAYGAGGDAGRAAALRSVVESESVYRTLYNPAFVLSQYFGYLRRDPDAEGYDFWLAKLDSFSLPGEDVRDESVALARVRRAEMVKAFMTSLEYRGRFGEP